MISNLLIIACIAAIALSTILSFISLSVALLI